MVFSGKIDLEQLVDLGSMRVARFCHVIRDMKKSSFEESVKPWPPSGYPVKDSKPAPVHCLQSAHSSNPTNQPHQVGIRHLLLQHVLGRST